MHRERIPGDSDRVRFRPMPILSCSLATLFIAASISCGSKKSGQPGRSLPTTPYFNKSGSVYSDFLCGRSFSHRQFRLYQTFCTVSLTS